MADQIKYSFDKTTMGKIGRGALISATGALALYLLNALQEISLGSMWVPIVGAVVPILVNMVREWMKGESKPIA